MLDREVVKEFLREQFEDNGIKIPKKIPEKTLIETFCSYVEDDYYEWLKDNYKSFFRNDWAWIREKIKCYSKDRNV